MPRALIASIALAWCLLIAALMLGAPPGQAWAAGAQSGQTGHAAAAAAPMDTPGVGAQPTRQNLAQPTIGAAQDVPSGSYTPTGLTSPWLLVFTALGCVLGLLSLGTLLVTWYMLASDGWGPVVKAVLLGNRKGKRRFAQRQSGSARGVRRPEPVPVSARRSRDGWR